MAAAPTSSQTLCDAAERGDLATVERLISEGVSTKELNHRGETAAHIAAKTGNAAIVEYLLSRDKSLLAVKDNTGQNILHAAALKGATDIVKYVVDKCRVDIFLADNLYRDNYIVHVAAREGHMDLLQYFFEEKHFDVNVQNERGETPIFMAAGHHQLPVIRYLVDQHNANLKICDYDDRHILFQAAMKDDLTVAAYVVDEKRINLDINHKDKIGRTIVHWSALRNHLNITQYFIDEKKADINVPDLMKQTALHLAAEAGHVKMVEYLYEFGADPEFRDAYGKTPAETAKDEQIIKFLAEFPKRRLRRSAPQSSPPTIPHRSIPYSFNWVRAISADLFRSRGQVEGDHANLERTVPSAGWNSFLALANVVIRAKRSTNEDRSLRASTGNANSRVDPAAEEIIQNILDNASYD